jgi:uracil-DNA glycosylase
MAVSLDEPPAARLPEAVAAAAPNRLAIGVTPLPVQPSPGPLSSSLDELRAVMMACARCPKLTASRSRVVPGHGALPAAIAFIGLAPGRFGGDRTGIPFDGDRSGELLRRMIKHARLSHVFITNVVRCNPRDERGRNRDPDPAEIANCRDHLEAELALANPKIVACLGRIAWHALAGREFPFAPCAPEVTERSGLRLFPMYHPAYVVRGAYPERSYRRDFRRLRASYAKLPAASPRNPGD